jgi:hypothetical protein
MKKIIYLCSPPKTWGLSTANEQLKYGHNFGTIDETPIIWPETLTLQSVNPKNIESVFFDKPARLIVLDRVKNHTGIFPIKSHVNKSGYNFLSGNTPYKNKPRFPDISSAYDQHIKNPNSRNVITVGPKRFLDQNGVDEIISEAAGMVVPVLHYIGLCCEVWGANPPIKESDLIETTR